ncbi:hypothetical protein ElyMa_004388400 [Elysia marginata]|uniref:Secreted protein n=1 Tax=Elysia marginata TaxID=1093978 RepID=A0AAV4H7G1_9GAST|nr:hypothetical protein ElyMa_004388400 [Elysia marginata]
MGSSHAQLTVRSIVVCCLDQWTGAVPSLTVMLRQTLTRCTRHEHCALTDVKLVSPSRHTRRAFVVAAAQLVKEEALSQSQREAGLLLTSSLTGKQNRLIFGNTTRCTRNRA